MNASKVKIHQQLVMRDSSEQGFFLVLQGSKQIVETSNVVHT